ncbi:MAG: HD domain-containing protein [Ruminococcaceae bacterium]|nr:HD domain-containing protein [Oscillospiraceae bacterium]
MKGGIGLSRKTDMEKLIKDSEFLRKAIPDDILLILSRLEAAGIGAYIVGGAVRDILMGNTPEDFDIAAETEPSTLTSVFSDRKTVDVGIRFGTLTVDTGKRLTEITCCRRESSYPDIRHPDSVEYTMDIVADLARRDFTVNAVAMDCRGKIYDPFGGIRDIEQRILRAVGEPSARFKEDALRILRGIRFSSTLGFRIESGTKSAIHCCRPLLTCVSEERMFCELCKLLCGDNVRDVLTEYSDEICTLIPELRPTIGFCQNNPHHIYTVYDHIALSVSLCKKDVVLRLAMLFHDIAKPAAYSTDNEGIGHFKGHPHLSAVMAGNILKRLKADGDTVKKVCFLVEHHDIRPSATRKSLHKYLRKVGFRGAYDLLYIRRADLGAQSPDFHYLFEYLDESERIIKDLEKEGACISLDTLAVNGRDLINMGFERGPDIGRALDMLLSAVVREEAENRRDVLLRKAEKIKKSFNDSFIS